MSDSGHRWNDGLLEFTVEKNGRIHLCRVSKEVFQDRFDTDGTRKTADEAFLQNRDQFEKVANQRIDTGRIETDGSLVLRAQDFEQSAE